MHVEKWMSTDVVTCRPEDDLGDAARKMWERDCGGLPVVDGDGRVIAMLTDRDALMDALHRGAPLRELAVKDAMSRQVYTCLAGDPIEEVVRLMGDHRIRRIPVVDRAGRVVGIVALGDLVRGLVTMMELDERHRLSTRLVEALACVSEPRHDGTESLETTSAAPRRPRVTVERARSGATKLATSPAP